MNKEIDISEVPLTPKGVNHDFQSVKKYEFVRFDDAIKIKTKVLINPDTYLSNNEVDISLVETNEQRVDAIVKSPMVEVRRKRQSTNCNINGVRFNPKRDDVIETSSGCYTNYEQSRRKTIAVMKRSLSPNKQQSHKKRRSLSNSGAVISNKENLDAKVKLESELDLLVAAIDHSQTLLSIEKKRLSDMIDDWSHILEIEKDIPLENQGDIKSAIGGLRILLNKRFESTLDLLVSAEKYVDNHGIPTDEKNKHYRSEDIYGFVDLLIEEIKKIDVDFNFLLNMRNNRWIKDTSQTTEALKVPAKKVKKVDIKKKIKSRIDLAFLRRKYLKSDIKGSSAIEMCFILPKDDDNAKKDESNETNYREDIRNENITHDKIDMNMNESPNELSLIKTTSTSGMKKGNQLKSINSDSGIPAYNDTPTNEMKKNNKSDSNEEEDVKIDVDLSTSQNESSCIKITPPFLKNVNRPKSILKSGTGNPIHDVSNNENVKFVKIDCEDEGNDVKIDASMNTSQDESFRVIKTPTSSMKKGIRSKSVLKSNTGTPVHNDTPRPRKSCRKTNEFAIPSLNNVVSKKFPPKRSVTVVNDEDSFTSPISMSKKGRKSVQEK